MEERVLISLLLDFYGPLLTDKQRMSLQLHHEDDMSLGEIAEELGCLLYTSPSPRDMRRSRMPSSA